MQKISFYLVTNRISVTTDMISGGYTTENRQVYQRKLKLYKGIDNTIELEVKASDQKRMSVIGHTVVIKFYDVARKNLFTVLGYPVISKTGILSVTVPEEVLTNIDPQQLTLAAFLRDSNNKETILYADGQFDVSATVELYNGYNDASKLIDTVKTFIYDFGSKDYISEIVDFGTKINDDYSTYPTSSAEVIVTPNASTPYTGTITVEATDDKSLALGNRWTVIGTIAAEDYSGIRFTGEWRFVRFRFPRWVDNLKQTDTTGLVDKIIINN